MPTSSRTTRQPVRAVARPAGRPLPGGAPRPSPSSSTETDPTTFRAIVAGVVALVVVATGFGVHEFLDRPDAGPQVGCAIGIDSQGATSGLRANIERWLPAQVASCSDDGHGVVDVFLATAQTTTNLTPSESSNFRDDVDRVGNDDVDADRVADEVDDLVARVDANILGAPRQSRFGTDLVGASCVAASLLRGRRDKTLVLFTDALNGAEPYRLRVMDLDEASITEAVEAALASGELCELVGVEVHMFGVGMSRVADTLEPGRLEAVEQFWRAAWAAAGADLVSFQREP